jgi:hypothetical protein
MRVSDGVRSVTTVVRHFWQNHPKAVSFARSKLSQELWPAEGHRPADEVGAKSGAYRLEGGRHKTHEVVYAFEAHPGRDPEALARAVAAPLFARAPWEWYARSGALGAMAPLDVSLDEPELAGALVELNRLQEAIVDAGRTEPRGHSMAIHTLRESRGASGAARPDVDMYGWMSFGDLPGSLSWDWPHGMLLAYLRHEGKREFLDLAEEMTRHRYDVDGRPGEEDAGPGRIWIGGLVLHHALTGDPRSLAAARENVEAFSAYYDRGLWIRRTRVPVRRLHELRAAGMAIQGLLDFHGFTGEEEHLQIAKAIFSNHVAYGEELCGSNGFAGLEDDDLPAVVRLLEPLRRLHEAEGDPEVLTLMLRVLRRIGRADLESPGDGLGFFTADAFAYASRVTGEQELLTLARRLFRDSIDRREYVGLETGARVLRGHQVYLNVEWLRSSSESPGAAEAPAAEPRVEEPPPVVRVGAPAADRVIVEFGEEVDRASAGRAASYRISPAVPVWRAWLDDTGRRVELQTGPIDGGLRYELTVRGVRARDGRPPGSGASRSRAFYRDIVADDDDPSFRVLGGEWRRSVTAFYAYSGAARTARELGASAEWRIAVPAGGRYEVHAWWPRMAEGGPVTYRITHVGGATSPQVDQAEGGGRWHRLGAFPFSKEDGAVVRITCAPGGTAHADAIRLVYLEP